MAGSDSETGAGVGFFGLDYGAGLVLRQINAKCGAAAFVAGNRNGAVMIADDGLHDGEAEAGALHFGRVVRSEEAGALFGVRPLPVSETSMRTVSPASEVRRRAIAAGGHGVERVEHKILKRAMQQISIGVNFRKRFAQEIFRGDGRLADSIELRFKEANGVAQRFVDIQAGELRRGHFGEIAEAPDDAVEIGEFGFQCGRRFTEDFLKLVGAKLAGTLEILHRDLQREKRIAKFVRQAAGQFTPGGNALGLH